MAVTMEFPEYPNPDVLLARLVRSSEVGLPQGNAFPKEEHPPNRVEEPPTEEFLSRLAERVGLQSHDLFLIAGRVIPDDALRFDEEASRELPQLVKRALALPASGRQRLRDRARFLAELPPTVFPGGKRSLGQYPPGFGSLLVRMLALRNLGWSSAAKVMYLMSGVYLSAATIGAVGRGVKELDPELLNGFAAVLGVPDDLLASLTGMNQLPVSRRRREEVIETAALLWDVRHLAARQVRQLSHMED
ncbi:hypothetical protein ABZ864_38695 [Streptomyces sp. NPDC047082]|uniref:hypothetical protein n=1 Tax=Streptomyces sp. NPDC047082 TaxID=3155259 RepID=UPI003411E752